MKNKLITKGLEAINELSLQKVKEQLVKGEIRPSAFEALDGHEQLYVKYVVFEKRSPEVACDLISKKLFEINPSVLIEPSELRLRYMLDPRIKKAIHELLSARDIEESLIIQSRSNLAQSIIAGLMVNSESEEIRLRAATEIMKHAAADYKNKRAKTQIDKKVTNVDATVVWEIRQYDKNEELPSENIIDATIVSTKKKGIERKKEITNKENDTPLEMSFASADVEDDVDEDDDN